LHLSVIIYTLQLARVDFALRHACVLVRRAASLK